MNKKSQMYPATKGTHFVKKKKKNKCTLQPNRKLKRSKTHKTPNEKKGHREETPTPQQSIAWKPSKEDNPLVL